MARPRLPTTVLNLRGAFKNHPERKKDREGEPEVYEPLGDAPDCLNEAQIARWNEIAGWCSWLTVADRVVVELVARLWQALRDGTAKPPDVKSLLTGLVHLGMTPADRSRIKVPGKKPKANKFGALTG